MAKKTKTNKNAWRWMIAKAMMKKYIFKTMRDNEQIYYYENGKYHQHGEAFIKQYCESKCGSKLTSFDINEIINHIRRSTYINRREFEPPLNLVNVANGIIDISTGEFKEHDPSFFF